MYCYYNKQLFNFNFLDDYSDASTMESQDTDVNVLNGINKGIYCLIFLIFK